MNRKTIVKRLQQTLPNYPIKKAWLFGSFATGEATANSDVDLLVDYDKTDNFTLFTIGSVISGLSSVLGLTVDVVEYDRVLPFAKKSIDDTKILIYERIS